MSTYHRERPDYLDVAFKSIWTDQIRKPEQIVLVEDGPLTEGLYDVINKWKKEIGQPLTIIQKKENCGLASALNDGIAQTTGELIARMDSDDIAMPLRLKLQESYMKSHEDVDILGGSIQEFNDTHTINIIREYPKTMDDIRSSIHKASPLAHPTVMFRRRIFNNGLKYSSKYYICEDVTLWFDAIKSNYIINNIPDILLRFRRNDSMMQRRGRKKAWGEFLAYCEGIYMLNGLFTFKYFYSIARLIFRLSPTSLIRFIYNSRLRRFIVKG